MASQKNERNGRIPAAASATPWEVEIRLADRRVASERVRAQSSRQAVERALALRGLETRDILEMSARPLPNSRPRVARIMRRSARYSATARLVNAMRAAA